MVGGWSPSSSEIQLDGKKTYAGKKKGTIDTRKNVGFTSAAADELAGV